jgi:hypothetical protein
VLLSKSAVKAILAAKRDLRTDNEELHLGVLRLESDVDNIRVHLYSSTISSLGLCTPSSNGMEASFIS